MLLVNKPCVKSSFGGGSLRLLLLLQVLEEKRRREWRGWRQRCRGCQVQSPYTWITLTFSTAFEKTSYLDALATSKGDAARRPLPWLACNVARAYVQVSNISWLEYYQALLWWIFQMGKFLWESATLWVKQSKAVVQSWKMYNITWKGQTNGMT